jgi:hypothetical protein
MKASSQIPFNYSYAPLKNRKPSRQSYKTFEVFVCEKQKPKTKTRKWFWAFVSQMLIEMANKTIIVLLSGLTY